MSLAFSPGQRNLRVQMAEDGTCLLLQNCEGRGLTPCSHSRAHTHTHTSASRSSPFTRINRAPFFAEDGWGGSAVDGTERRSGPVLTSPPADFGFRISVSGTKRHPLALCCFSNGNEGMHVFFETPPDAPADQARTNRLRPLMPAAPRRCISPPSPERRDC